MSNPIRRNETSAVQCTEYAKTTVKRKDKHFFGKVARKYGDDTQDFFVSNFLKNEKGYIGEFNDRNFTDWKKRHQSLRYMFEQDMNLLLNQVSDFNKLFTVENGQHPILFRNYLSQRINIETMIILNKLVNYQKDWDKQINENIIWPNHRNKLNNYDYWLKHCCTESDVKKQKNVFNKENDITKLRQQVRFISFLLK